MPKSDKPTARQRFILEHIERGTVTVTHAGLAYSRWHICMPPDYCAGFTRQPSNREGEKLVKDGWVILEVDHNSWTENTLTKERHYHHRARLTQAGLAALHRSVHLTTRQRHVLERIGANAVAIHDKDTYREWWHIDGDNRNPSDQEIQFFKNAGLVSAVVDPYRNGIKMIAGELVSYNEYRVSLTDKGRKALEST
jgi:hypothetical protein